LKNGVQPEILPDQNPQSMRMMLSVKIVYANKFGFSLRLTPTSIRKKLYNQRRRYCWHPFSPDRGGLLSLDGAIGHIAVNAAISEFVRSSTNPVALAEELLELLERFRPLSSVPRQIEDAPNISERE
jgi:hypothetical protein